MRVPIVKILIDKIISIIKLICQLPNHFLLFRFIGVPNVRFTVLFKPVYKFLKSHHSIKARGVPLNTNPNLIRLLLANLFHYCLVNLWSYIKVLRVLSECWTPKKDTIAISATNVAILVMNLLPFMSIYNFLHSQVPCKAVAVMLMDFCKWLEKIFLELEFVTNRISVESHILDLIRLKILT